ncbi:FAD-binding protein [Streptosporangium sp. NBC_01756]|uniref:FAD-binding protein n=1 Tax=Streptosporangium sp. NBC_01756 TaxID=2975950 RepID=UPI002DD825FD|nr:FAD-binding protein [Streptosporangium sp. NBC_01756]WSC84544.1 FAD-binding protein [Streptosporangium sp. NBC_01756]
MSEPQTNWAGNVTYGAARLHRPDSVERLQDVVAGSGRLRALGTRHSFNRIADCPDGDLVSLENLPASMELDTVRHTVTVSAGVRYGELARWLHDKGYALHNLGSLPHISVAGACATATHGSGDANGNLSTAVAGIEMVTADGEITVLTRERDGDRLRGAVVGLGALGIVTRLTLDVVPAFDVRQDVYENLPWARLEDHFEEIFSATYSVSLFTRWRGPQIDQVWLKRRVDGSGDAWEAAPEWLDATLAETELHPLPGMPAANCTRQLGVPGPWHERLPHFRLDFTPSSGEELQSEYLVPRRHAIGALRALDRIRDGVASVLQVSEIRTVAADDLWMSPCYGQGAVALHFTWKKDWPAVSRVLTLVEEALEPFEARPHWGKLFVTSPERLRSRYERLPDFQRLLGVHDPTGKFRNAFVDDYIFGENPR